MTDLHLDVMSMYWHVERSKWSIKLTIYIGKGGEREDAFDEDDIHNGYERIYIPMTLTRCLVVEDGAITQVMLPTYQVGIHDNIEYQDIWIGGKEFHLMSMQTYWEMKKKL